MRDHMRSKGEGPEASSAVVAGGTICPSEQDDVAALDWRVRTIRVTEIRPDGFVAFDFSIGEEALYVEMLLSREAFDDFCRQQNITPVFEAHAPAQESFPVATLYQAARSFGGPASASPSHQH